MLESVNDARETVARALERIPSVIVTIMAGPDEIGFNGRNGFALYAFRAAVREATRG